MENNRVNIINTTPWVSQKEYETIMGSKWQDEKTSKGNVLSFSYFEVIARNILDDVYNKRITILGGAKADEILAFIPLQPQDQYQIKYATSWYIRELRFGTRKEYEILSEYSSQIGNINTSWGTLAYENLKQFVPQPSRSAINAIGLQTLIYDNKAHYRRYLDNQLQGDLELPL